MADNWPSKHRNSILHGNIYHSLQLGTFNSLKSRKTFITVGVRWGTFYTLMPFWWSSWAFYLKAAESIWRRTQSPFLCPFDPSLNSYFLHSVTCWQEPASRTNSSINSSQPTLTCLSKQQTNNKTLPLCGWQWELRQWHSTASIVQINVSHWWQQVFIIKLKTPWTKP